jgi:hypothetical protein
MMNNNILNAWKMERGQIDKALSRTITDEEWQDWQAHEREMERLLMKSITTGKNLFRGNR